jgi:twitching motility protein PilT
MVNHINQTEARHILVIEDPIEYLHTHKKSLVNQRQVGEDVRSYSEALDAATDQDTDVIVAGDLPDGESVVRAVSAVETGRLVLAATPAATAKEVLNRLSEMVQGINGRLANVLGGIVVLDRDHAARVVSREVVSIE